MSLYENEIDLRPYISATFKRWWLIALLAIIAGIVTVVFTLLSPVTYTSKATILLARSRMQLSLADDFQTVTDPVDRRSNLDTMLAISNSSGVVEDTIDVLREKYPEVELSIPDLQESVNISTEGNLIAIEITASQADLAVDLANEWAKSAVRAINAAYSEEQPLAEVQNQRVEAEEEYLAAQAELEEFIRTSPVTLLQQQVQEEENILLNQASEINYKISFYTQRKLSLEALISQAEALKKQLQAGSNTPAAQIGDALMLINTRAQALALRGSLLQESYTLKNQTNTNESTVPTERFFEISPYSVESGDLTIDLDATGLVEMGIDPSQASRDLDILLEIAQEEAALVSDAIAQLVAEKTSGEQSNALQATSTRLQNLRSELEAANARQRMLSSQRDTAWEAFQALARKETELKQGSNATNYVNVATVAALPEVPDSRGLIMKAAIAAILASILGIVILWSNVWVQSAKSQHYTEVNPVGGSTD